MPILSEDERVALGERFLAVWPDAAYGPAHIVLADQNVDDEHIRWCEGILYAIQRNRHLGGTDAMYPDHSDAELEATVRVLYEMTTGAAPQRVEFNGPDQQPTMITDRWQDVSEVPYIARPPLRRPKTQAG